MWVGVGGVGRCGGRARRIVGILIALIVWVAPGVAPAADSGSSTFQIDPAHDGKVTFAASFAPPLTKLWSIDFGGHVSYPVVAGKLVIVLADSGIGTRLSAIGTRLVALDTATGTIVWQKIVEFGAAYSHLAYDDGIVFLSPYYGPLQAFSAATGTPLWAAQLPQLPTNENESFYDDVPIIANNLIFAAGESTGGNIYAFDEHSGSLSWSLAYVGGNSILTFGGGRLYVPFTCDVGALVPATGRVTWNYSIGCSGGGYGFAAYYRGLLYAPTVGKVLSDTAPRVIRQFGDNLPVFSGSKYFVMANQALTANAIDTGTRSWSFAIKESVSLPPITVNGNVYTLSDTGNLYINAGLTGVLLQTVAVGLGQAGTPNAAPASGLGSGDGRIFVPSGSIFAAFAPKR